MNYVYLAAGALLIANVFWPVKGFSRTVDYAFGVLGLVTLAIGIQRTFQ
jgi:hypothetical protein